MTRNEKAFLDMLAFAELGPQIIAESDDGYNVLVGSLPGRLKLFHNYSDHPRVLVQVKSRSPGGIPITIPSTAAGRYQILKRNFDYYRKFLNLPDFGKVSQDAIALQLIQEKGAHTYVLAGSIETAITRCRTVWASLPGAGYGQPEKSIEKLLAAYVDAGGRLAGV